MPICEHLEEAQLVKPNSAGCEECIAMGDHWVHLRTCLTCGNVGCCDSSKNKHASKHARKVGHPVVASKEPGERWMWCFVDQEIAEY